MAGAVAVVGNKRIVTNDPALGRLIATGSGATFDTENDTSLALVNDSHPTESPAWFRGGVLYTAFTGASISLHVYGRNANWMTHDFLWAAFDYPFNQLGCGRVFSLIESANEPALRFALKLGYSIGATLPRMFASGAGVIVCMERDDCPWLKLRPRQIASGSAISGNRGS